MYTKVDYDERVCHKCRKSFKPKTKRSLFCSENCRRRVRKHPYKKFRKSYCEECLWIPVHNCQLDVDHIDGNSKNDDPANLRTLCANCHRLKTYIQEDFRGPQK